MVELLIYLGSWLVRSGFIVNMVFMLYYFMGGS